MHVFVGISCGLLGLVPDDSFGLGELHFRLVQAVLYALARHADFLTGLVCRGAEQFLRIREEFGMKVVALDATSRVGPELLELLADNWLIALVADRDLTGRGVDVDMFGATRKLPAGPALLSLTSGAPLLPCSVYTTDAGWHCRIGEPLE